MEVKKFLIKWKTHYTTNICSTPTFIQLQMKREILQNLSFVCWEKFIFVKAETRESKENFQPRNCCGWNKIQNGKYIYIARYISWYDFNHSINFHYNTNMFLLLFFVWQHNLLSYELTNYKKNSTVNCQWNWRVFQDKIV